MVITDLADCPYCRCSLELQNREATCVSCGIRFLVFSEASAACICVTLVDVCEGGRDEHGVNPSCAGLR